MFSIPMQKPSRLRSASSFGRLCTRRNFLSRGSIALAAASIVPGWVYAQSNTTNRSVSPNSKLNIAVIGLNGQGRTDLRAVSSENIIALCDVDTRAAARAAKGFPKAKIYQDFRKMFDEIGDELDAVAIATPDHSHAVVAMRAIQTGKHVYCQKPLAHSIYEVRSLMKAAREHKVITQLGNQGHSFDSIRVFREWVEADAIGAVREAHAFCSSVYSQADLLEAVKKGEPRPAHLDWDLWLGPAQPRPYHPAYHPGKWRNWTRFGTGVIGDWTCHIIDPVFWTLDLGAPASVEAIQPDDYNPRTQGETFPAGNVIRFEFPAKADRAPVRLTWYDGPQRPPRPEELDPGEHLPDYGAIVVGQTGKIIYGSHGASAPRILPEAREESFKREPRKYARSPGQHKEWLGACKSGKPAGCDFSYGGPLTEIALLGVIAMRFRGKKLQWNSEAMKFTNSSDANAFLTPDFREGWEI